MILNILGPILYFIILQYLAYIWLAGEGFVIASIALVFNSLMVLYMHLRINGNTKRRAHTVVQYILGLLLIPLMIDSGSWGMGLIFGALLISFIATPINVFMYVYNLSDNKNERKGLSARVIVYVCLILLVFAVALIEYMFI